MPTDFELSLFNFENKIPNNVYQTHSNLHVIYTVN